MAALMRVALVFAMTACTREHTVDFELVLTPGCSCAGPGEISLAAGGKVGFFALDGAMVESGVCAEIPVAGGTALSALPQVLNTLDPRELEGDKPLTFKLRVARPSSELACEPTGSEGPPLILFGQSAPAKLTGNTITIGLSCSSDAC